MNIKIMEILEMLLEVRAQEREECAKLAEDLKISVDGVDRQALDGSFVAMAIRARSDKGVQ